MFNFLFAVLLAKSCSVLKQDVKQFKLKLTNKEIPCLTLEMEVVSNIMFTLQLKIMVNENYYFAWKNHER